MINKVILVGNLGADPEIRSYETTELKVIKCSVATSKNYKDRAGEWKTETQWHKVEMWRKNIPDYLKKGDKVYIEGSIKYEEYEGKWYTKINANTIRSLEKKENTTTHTQPSYSPPPQTTSSTPDHDDDLPF